jgi:hypothetical protein
MDHALPSQVQVSFKNPFVQGSEPPNKIIWLVATS